MQSEAQTVAQYLKSLPPERSEVVKKIRKIVNENIQSGFQETMRWGMISWEIPLKTYPNTYNKQPLNYIGLAAQKNAYSLYLMSCYVTDKVRQEFEATYQKTGKRLDMGKSCIRFKKIEDLPLELVAKYIARYDVNEFIDIYEKSRAR